MKNLIIPAILLIIGTGSALATKTADNKKAVLVSGYHINQQTGLCEITDQKCNTVGVDLCFWSEDGSTQLRNQPISPTMCGTPLFKVE
ncbi:DUF6520 family protein [Chryseobacterium polytrichastri]|uniref:DUF333 domain-containing protein n=1 Tax=Chryseobacterium polytrichastri TaxID=1302687 RepID=A0A1M6VUE6_9FLAO|nr:DUF6520 family protein [Chryseobacterium polytrichastri]SHK85078.1 hypothetical protein SAMN05444267_1008146 [Chryseobacterium polytrichastri]